MCDSMLSSFRRRGAGAISVCQGPEYPHTKTFAAAGQLPQWFHDQNKTREISTFVQRRDQRVLVRSKSAGPGGVTEQRSPEKPRTILNPVTLVARPADQRDGREAVRLSGRNPGPKDAATDTDLVRQRVKASNEVVKPSLYRQPAVQNSTLARDAKEFAAAVAAAGDKNAPTAKAGEHKPENNKNIPWPSCVTGMEGSPSKQSQFLKQESWRTGEQERFRLFMRDVASNIRRDFSFADHGQDDTANVLALFDDAKVDAKTATCGTTINREFQTEASRNAQRVNGRFVNGPGAEGDARALARAASARADLSLAREGHGEQRPLDVSRPNPALHCKKPTSFADIEAEKTKFIPGHKDQLSEKQKEDIRLKDQKERRMRATFSELGQGRHPFVSRKNGDPRTTNFGRDGDPFDYDFAANWDTQGKWALQGHRPNQRSVSLRDYELEKAALRRGARGVGRGCAVAAGLSGPKFPGTGAGRDEFFLAGGKHSFGGGNPNGRDTRWEGTGAFGRAPRDGRDAADNLSAGNIPNSELRDTQQARELKAAESRSVDSWARDTTGRHPDHTYLLHMKGRDSHGAKVLPKDLTEVKPAGCGD